MLSLSDNLVSENDSFFVLGNSKTKNFQMMADHGEPCDGQETTYCMNGGMCYKIPSMDTLSCVCNDNFKGSRCEHFQLLSTSPNAKEAGLIAAVVIVIILLLIVLAVVIYFVRKMLKAKNQNQQNNSKQQKQEYWRVKSRV
ncbi:pro-neuregulin-2, membrane-bound isoform [Leuresthes tenuis]|uniref:pro-neuregulin-2, membrane-bound isoform n=1 Tax=Leuresthes tenuis TaxID=355514 RepID=UPI003B504D09